MNACFYCRISGEYKFTVVALVVFGNTSMRFEAIGAIGKSLVCHSVHIAHAIVDQGRDSRPKGHVTVSRLSRGFVIVIYIGRVIEAIHVTELVDRFLNIGHNGQNGLSTVPCRVVTVVWYCQ